MLEAWTRQLGEGYPLAEEQIREAVAALTDETLPAAAKADFLIALAQKGETAAEIAAFARELRARALQPPLASAVRAREILDVVGTGGDHLHTFNISTTAALVVAAASVTVAKHGNRAITSQTGSADVLEALGIPINLTPEQAARSLGEHGFAFFFAPAYHPAFKHIGPARKLCAERGQRTIFNFLGPLLNPARPTAQLVGVPRPQLCEPIAQVLQSLGVRRGMVVSGQVPAAVQSPTSKGQSPAAVGPMGEAWLDELSTLGETTLAEFYQEHALATATLTPDMFPIQPATLADLVGGDRQANAETVRRLLRGEDRGPKRDAVLLNAGAALLVAGKTRTLTDGWATAAELIDSGQAHAKLEALVTARS